MDQPRRVHVVPVRHEVDRVVEPLAAQAADCVHFLFHDGDRSAPPTYHEDLVACVREELGASVATWHVDHFDVYDVFGLVTTVADAHADDDVAVNVSAGSKLAAIGASLACMDVATDATAYYVRPASRAHDGASAPATTGVAAVDELPTYPIDSPTRDQVVVLLLVAVENAGLSQPTKRTLIERSLALAPVLSDFEFGHSLLVDAEAVGSATEADPPTFTDLSTAAKKGAYRRLDRRLDPLVERGHVTVAESGRHRHVELTPRGRNALRAFRHKATDAVAVLRDEELPSWLDDVGREDVDRF